MNPVHQVNHKTRFAKIVSKVAFASAIVGLLAFAFLVWQWPYYFPPQTEPYHGVKSGSMSGVGIKEIIGGIIFMFLLINMNTGLSLTIVTLMLASAISIISTTIVLISVGPRQCKLAWVSLCIFLNTCLLTFLAFDRNQFEYPNFAFLQILSFIGFGLSAIGALGTALVAVKNPVGHEEKAGRLLQLFAAGGFLLGMISFVVFTIANLFWK